MPRSITRAGVAALLVVTATAGCDTTREAGAMPSPTASPAPSSPESNPPRSDPPRSATPPLSSTELPTRKPAKPPKTPSDLVPADVIAGRVIRGGSGPCYGLITDEGTQYAVHSTAGRPLSEGSFVRIRFRPLRNKIDCGPGRPVLAIEITVLS